MGALTAAFTAAFLGPNGNGANTDGTPYRPKLADAAALGATADNAIPNAQDLSAVVAALDSKATQAQMDDAVAAIATKTTQAQTDDLITVVDGKAAAADLTTLETTVATNGALLTDAIALATGRVTQDQLASAEADIAARATQAQLNDLVSVVGTKTTQAQTNDLILVVDGKAEETDLVALQAVVATKAAAADLTTTAAGLTALGATVTTLVGTVGAQRTEYQTPCTRPGDAPLRFALAPGLSQLAAAASLPPIPASVLVTGDAGNAVRLTGRTVLAPRIPVAIEAGRLYRPRYVITRAYNPSDPANDAVWCGVLWLGQNNQPLYAASAYTNVQEFDDLLVASGLQDVQGLFARSANPDALFTAPLGARYALPYVFNFGLDGATDVTVLDLADVTNANVLAPETAGTVAAVEALTSENLGPRVSEIEAQLQGPNQITFASRSDAQSGAIPTSVNIVELQGLVTQGDGGGGLFVRLSRPAAANLDTFVNDGVTFGRILPSAALFASWMNVLLPVYLAGLSGTPPSEAGVVWNSGGLVGVSQ